MKKENIKWIAIQPLTGGMYLGAEEAIGHPAEFILSFEGLNCCELKEDGTYKSCGNEFYLQKYLEKHGRNPIRYDIKGGMYDSKLNETLKPTILYDGSPIDFEKECKDIDIAVAVPVCSGLSMATTASQDTKDERNCNMKFIAKYTLNVIKPKIYVFENAPTLMGSRGIGLVEEFKDMAKEAGYSVLFYKTNTKYHHNCQNRPRTFVVFFKHIGNNENEEPFVWEYENAFISIKEYFSKIDNTLNGESLPTSKHNWVVIDFVKKLYGDNWRDYVEGNIMSQIIRNGQLEALKEFASKYEDSDKVIKYIDHIIYKKSLGKNYYQDDICLCKEHFPAVQFRSMYNMLHPTEDRICSIRENLALMGHPDDFEWLTGDDRTHLPKIGQNVPVKTAKFIVEQCVKSLEKWNDERGTERNASFQDNTKGVKVW